MGRANTATKIITDDGDDDAVDNANQNANRANGAANGAGGGNNDAPQYEAIEVDDNGTPLGGAADDDGADERRGQDEDRGREKNLSDDESGDQPLISNKRDREREPHSQRRARQRAAREAKDREIEELRSQLRETRSQLEDFQQGTGPRIASLEKRFSKEAASQLEANVEKAAAALTDAKKALAKALREGDEEQVSAALDARDKAFVDKLTADGAKEQYTRQTKNRGDDGDEGDTDTRQRDREDRDGNRGGRQRNDISPRGMVNVDKFCDDNPWFDPDGRDEDSKLVLFIDAQVKRAGYRPENDDYWDELHKRLAKRMPERFSEDALEDDDDDDSTNRKRTPARNGNGAADGRRTAANPQRRGPMTGGGESRPANGNARPGTVKITPARKEALVLAGVVGNDGRIIDQPKYQRMLRQYAEFDQEQSRANGAR